MPAPKKIRLGVIGAGAVVREIYQHLYFHSDYAGLLEICAVADPNPANRDWLGGLASLPNAKRFADYREMIAREPLDAVQVNTPDHAHAEPTVAALDAGLHVVVAKPIAASVRDAHAMIAAAKRARRFLGVDFHKREDPRIREAKARFRSGRYGTLQAALLCMLDKLFVADPNHSPRFFASADFAETNTPVSFLTVHMADALMDITGLLPAHVRAVGFSQKLPSLQPIPVNGYDLVDTEVVFDTGAVAHILAGWALPNTAWSTTVQSARLICSEGLVDLGIDTPGLLEIHRDGVAQVNPLFRNFEPGGRVSGYGIDRPGRFYLQIAALLASEAGAKPAYDPLALGFHTTLVLEAAERSLALGTRLPTGVTMGRSVDLRQWAAQELGAEAAAAYGLAPVTTT